MRIIVLLVLFLGCSVAVAQDSYLCISELSTGFEFNKSTGKYHQINYGEEKYILKKTNKLLNQETTNDQHWGWFIFGIDDALIAVGQGIADDGLLFLNGLSNVRFNMNTLRYDSTSYGAHPFDDVDVAMKSHSYYSVTIGSCSKI